MKTRYYTTIAEIDINVRKYINSTWNKNELVPQSYRNILMFLTERNYDRIRQVFGDGGTTILLGIKEHEKVDIEEIQIADYINGEQKTVMLLCRREFN